jgi:hypothetical protein
VLITNAIRKRQEKIFKLGILTLLGQIFLVVGRVKEVTVRSLSGALSFHVKIGLFPSIRAI